MSIEQIIQQASQNTKEISKLCVECSDILTEMNKTIQKLFSDV